MKQEMYQRTSHLMDVFSIREPGFWIPQCDAWSCQKGARAEVLIKAARKRSLVARHEGDESISPETHFRTP